MAEALWVSGDETPENRLKYGTILDITPASITNFASGVVCFQRGGEPIPEDTVCRVLSRHLGSASVVFTVDIGGAKIVLRVPADGWEGKWTEAGKTRLRCHAEMLAFLRHIGLPVPEVYLYEVDLSSPIGAPFLAMSFLEGESLDHQWNDPYGQKDPESPEDAPSPMHDCDETDRRKETLRSLAIYMQTISLESFHSVGSVTSEENSSSLGIGDVYSQIRERLQLENSILLPQTTDANEFKRYKIDRQVPPNTSLPPEEVGTDQMVDHMIDWFPFDQVQDFTLRKPRLELRDIMVNDAGTVIGILDWENTLAFPRCLGSLIPPSWICVDWDPLQSTFRAAIDHELDDEENFNYLKEYRKFYYGTFLGPDPASNKDTVWCQTAPVREIVWRACSDPNVDPVRRKICRMILTRFRPLQYKTPLVQDRALREMTQAYSFSSARWAHLRRGMFKFCREGEPGYWI